MIVSNVIDSKGRFYFPKKDREDFKGKVVVFRFHDYLCFLTMQEWELFTLKRTEQNRTARFLCSSATVKKIDIDGKVYIPIVLRERRKEWK